MLVECNLPLKILPIKHAVRILYKMMCLESNFQFAICRQQQ